MDSAKLTTSNTADKMENLKELLTVSRKYDMLKGEEGIEKFLRNRSFAGNG